MLRFLFHLPLYLLQVLYYSLAILVLALVVHYLL